MSDRMNIAFFGCIWYAVRSPISSSLRLYMPTRKKFSTFRAPLSKNAVNRNTETAPVITAMLPALGDSLA